MTTDQKEEPQAQLLSALRAAEAVIEDVTDTLRFADGEPVTAFTDSEEIERVYLLMTGVHWQRKQLHQETRWGKAAPPARTKPT